MINITINDFIALFKSHWCDWDGAFGNQCEDLAQFWNHVIGNPQSFTGETADLIYNQPGDFYIQIPNAPDNFPVAGDIVVFKYPHVGIATGKNTDVNQVELLEQNDPTNGSCQIKIYNYSEIQGWLHPKQLPQDQQAIIDELRVARDNNWNLHLEDEGKIKSLQATLDSLNQTLNDRANDITQLNARINTLQTQLDSSQQEVTTLKPIAGTVPNLKEQLSQAEHDRQLCLNAQGSQNQLIANLRAQLSAGKPKTLKDKLIFLFT